MLYERDLRESLRPMKSVKFRHQTEATLEGKGERGSGNAQNAFERVDMKGKKRGKVLLLTGSC